VGGGALCLVPATTCKLCVILSSVEGIGTERYDWKILTVSKMTWLLVLALTNLKQ
jgi:hypothetical protein